MLQFFKSNNLSIVFANVVLIVLCRIPYLFFPVDVHNMYQHAEPAAKFFIRFLHIGPYTPQVWLLAGGALGCLIASLLINKIINSYRVTTRKNFLGGLLFSALSGIVPQCLVLNPALIAAIILLLCIDKLFELAKPDKLYSHIFDLGFLSALAMLFYFPAIYLLLFVSIGFFMMRSVSFRERVMVFIGFACVLLTVFTVYFWFDSLPEMFLDIINIQYRKPWQFNAFTHWQLAMVVWIFVIMFFVLANVPLLLFSSVIQTRKYMNILIIGQFLCLLVLPLAFNFNLSYLVFLMVPLAILAAVYFVETKTNLFNEILFIVLILSVFIFQYLPLLITI